MQTIVDLRKSDFHAAPDVAPIDRRLGVTADKIQSHGLDLSKALKPSGTGLVWAAVEEGQPIEHATGLAQQERARRSRQPDSGHQSRHQREGQPAEHADLRDAARHGRAGPGRARLDRPAGRPDEVDRHHRARRRRDRAADAPSRPAPLVGVRVHRDGREGRRRRLHRERLERGRHAVGVRHRRSASTRRSRCCAERSSAIAASIVSARKCISRPFFVTTRRTASVCCPRAPTSTSRFATAAIVSWTSARSKSTPGAAESGHSRCPQTARSATTRCRAVLAGDSEAAGRQARPRRQRRRGGGARSGRRRRAVEQDGARLIPGRGVPQTGLSRRRHLDRDDDAGWGPAPGRGDRPLPVRRADAQAADALDLHENAALVGARRHSRQVSGRALDVRRLARQPAAVAHRHGVRRRAAGGERTAAAVVRHRCQGGHSVLIHARRATSRTCRGSTSPTAPALSCIRHRGTSASSGCRISISRRTGVADRARRGRPRRRSRSPAFRSTSRSRRSSGSASAAPRATASTRGTRSARKSHRESGT